jgi:hypothetical protein
MKNLEAQEIQNVLNDAKYLRMGMICLAEFAPEETQKETIRLNMLIEYLEERLNEVE